MRERVVVTGMGCVCGSGLGAATCWESWVAGCSGVRPLQLVPAGNLRFAQGGEVPDYRPEDHFDNKAVTALDRFAQFAVIAAREAVQQAGLQDRRDLWDEAACLTGSCVGGQTTMDGEFVRLYRESQSRIQPLTIPRVMANSGASFIAVELGIHGPVYTVSTACSSANHAIGQAFHLVRNGVVPLALAGGSEAPFSLGLLKAWEAMRVVSPDVCRPFSADRQGLVLGEGGAMLVLESLSSAQARGVAILGEIVGFGMSSDAHHLTQPSSDGGARAMRMALRDADLLPEQVGYINAHGTGTMANDATETAAIHAVLGEHAQHVAVSSTKSMHGHTLGAAGAVEAIATLQTLQHGVLPPTINYRQPDPQCDLHVVPNQAEARAVEYALSNSFAFGGLNAVLAFRRWQ